MNVRVIAVGKLRERYVAAAVADFSARLRPYFRIDMVEVKPADGAHPRAAIATEGERILKLLADGETMWLLDRNGEELSSEEFAQRLKRAAEQGTSRLTFVVAGTYGSSEALRARAAVVWSLSRLTLLHEWARALVLEQLYRAAKIGRNEPYHH